MKISLFLDGAIGNGEIKQLEINKSFTAKHINLDGDDIWLVSPENDIILLSRVELDNIVKALDGDVDDTE